jgi:hypothetical protein
MLVARAPGVNGECIEQKRRERDSPSERGDDDGGKRVVQRCSSTATALQWTTASFGGSYGWRRRWGMKGARPK